MPGRHADAGISGVPLRAEPEALKVNDQGLQPQKMAFGPLYRKHRLYEALIVKNRFSSMIESRGAFMDQIKAGKRIRFLCQKTKSGAACPGEKAQCQ